ncbi:Asp23/Gls24 family envelope stress response protein [Microbacterium ulmi]|uniref:Asp23/Gls24 family envelope stress response protein n=1 Tax=Microbacterium ulmi TaxID=179095 RepID=A0A7Y2PZY2_9MICO|nr:Asp23/Gls24 family envelope stress response protein [Microbacterium ulmi]NII70693.1 putative alkaline shock family protein YloU [Microbacterium ulmi]NNH02712.1 Asp23/Gls24 family envelope stress response protein [Microbacterium ulmi]
MANIAANTQAEIRATGAPESRAAGKTTIEDGVVAKIAGIAARDVSGVYALGGGAARAIGAIRDALNTTDLSQGISVEVGEKQVAVDVTIVAEYPVALQKVADDVRTAIVRAMEDLVGMEVAEVNVTVNDVHVPTDEDQDSESSGSQEARVQ